MIDLTEFGTGPCVEGLGWNAILDFLHLIFHEASVVQKVVFFSFCNTVNLYIFAAIDFCVLSMECQFVAIYFCIFLACLTSYNRSIKILLQFSFT